LLTKILRFYTKKNLEENVTIFQKKQNAILKENFFSQSEEVVFRSFGEVIKIIGKKYYTVRGKKIDKIINLVESKSSFKVTLGGCLIKKINRNCYIIKRVTIYKYLMIFCHLLIL
jgi:tRNA(Ile)-lysidine synthase